jgi:hypothetical protein
MSSPCYLHSGLDLIIWVLFDCVLKLRLSTERDTGTYTNEVKFSDESIKVMVNGDLLSVPSHTQPVSIAARSLGPPNLPASKLMWLVLSLRRPRVVPE